MKRIGKGLLAILLTVTALLSSMIIEPIFAATPEGEYPVNEDAFVRSDRATTNYSFENITKDHGSQYDGKGYKVLNTKYYPDGRELMSVMKLKLPSAEEIATHHYDTFEFLFHIFKNADYAKGPQTYHFYYTTDVSWSESTLTWNNKPTSITHAGSDLFFDFTIAADKEYEFLSDSDKTIRVDVSDKIKSLVESGAEEITVFTAGNDKKDTSLMIHSIESADGAYQAKLIASNNDENILRLQALIEECEKIAADGYSSASYQVLQDQLVAAKEALASYDANRISQAYTALMQAKSNLAAEFPVLADAYVRSDKGTTNYSFENITNAHGSQYVGLNYKVMSAKRYENGNEIIGLMKFDVPSSEWLKQHDLDTYFLEFDIFKNPGFNNGEQTYHFYYTSETAWNETSVTWNNKHADIKHDGEKLLCDFTIKQGTEYEKMNDAQKHVKIDISEKIKEIADAGYSGITVFMVADKGMDTSLMIHTKESADGSKGAKITASYQDFSDRLTQLIAECQGLDEALYSKDSMAALQTILSQAEALGEDASALDIHIMYEKLKAAENALVSLADPSDSANIAYQKPTRTNLSKSQSKHVTDGDVNTYWQAQFYPAYVDIDLMQTYDIIGFKIFTLSGKTVNYTIYGSNDGTNYTRLYQKRDVTPMTNAGDTITLTKSEAYRIVRVYTEYTQGENNAYLSEVRVYGTATDSNSDELKNGSLEEILGVTSFADSQYAGDISAQETIDNVYGIIDRTIGAQYRNWFSFEIVNDNNENDWYEISDKNGKIHIKGNEGLSLTTGLNYYYKNYLNVHISEQTMQVSMPSALVKVNKTIRKETPYQVRYAFNYCTLSYTFAFFGQDEWQRENDWLALNGVNVVLDLAGQEATWIKFLMNFGYSFDDAKDWLTGPAYYAWQFMDNMEVFGGPIPDGYVKDRLEMARTSQRWKRSLGMQTVLQGYAGMVPTNFNEYQKDVKLLAQGAWNGFTRPSMIATDTQTYDEYARLFYEAQEFVYGATSDYYAVDPFHEGGKRPTDLSDSTIADEVLNSMLEYDKDAVWVVQGWQSNPTNDLLKGMGDRRENHVLIVDLIKYPIASWTKYNKTSYGSTKLDASEFNGTPWAWGLLANFGGNPSMHGQMETMVNDILNAQKTSEHMVGLGIISEAQYDNPVMYDLIFDLAWADESFRLDTWLQGYINRRYGTTSENARTAWNIMKNANYNHGVRYTNELFGMKSKAPQDYGKQDIPYGAENLESALRLLLEDFDKFKNSECYLYDITEMMRQQVSNYAVLKYNEVLDARSPETLAEFNERKDEFLNSLEVLNEVSATQKEQLGGEWIGKATDQGSKYDDFAVDTFEMGAKALITSWGSRSAHANLKDYGWRNYEGIFKDVYANIWSEYLNRVATNLANNVAVTTGNKSRNDYFDLYWQWNLTKQNYTRTAKDSAAEIKAIADRVLDECAISGELDQNIGNVALPGLAEATGEYENVNVVNDGDKETILEISGENAAVIIDLIGVFQLSKINIAADALSGDYEIFIGNDKNTWIKVGEKSDAKEDETGINYPLESLSARYIKVNAKDDRALLLKEIRAYGERVLPDLDQLKALLDFAEAIDHESVNQEKVKPFVSALKTAQESYRNAAAPDEAVTVYWALYDAIVALDLKTTPNIALHKTVSAHNDPSGHSERLTDGSLETQWDAGRLSATGKPYEDTITPGWAVVDLGDLYELENIQIVFGSQIWHHYEVYVSEDNQNWTKIGEKKTNELPGDVDNYEVDHALARYVKLYLTNVQSESSGKRYPIAVKELIVRGTKFKVKKAELSEAIQEAEKLDEALYTEASRKVLSEALTNAKQIEQSEEAAQAEVNAACDALRAAIKQLVYKTADYTKVDEMIAKADSLHADDYMDFSAVSEAVAAVIHDKNITEQKAVDAMADAIEEAIDKLELQAQAEDRAKLQALIDQAKALKEADYTATAWKQLVSAINSGEAALAKGKVSLTEVNQCMKAIDQALQDLKPLVDDRILTDENITVSGKLEENVTLVVIDTVKKANALFQQLCEKTGKYHSSYFDDKELLNIYDIKLMKNNAHYSVKESLQVSVAILKEWSDRKLEVIYIKDDGSFETVNAVIKEGTICFNVEHFSYYGIVAYKQSIDRPDHKPNDKPDHKPNQKPNDKPNDKPDNKPDHPTKPNNPIVPDHPSKPGDVLKPNDNVLKPNDTVLKPNGNELRPDGEAGSNQEATITVNTGVEDYLSLYVLLSIISGCILVMYLKKRHVKQWK